MVKQSIGELCESRRLFETFSKPRFRLQIRLRLARPRGCFDSCACFAYALRASDERTEPETESKAEAVDSKRALNSQTCLSRLAALKI